MPVGPIRKLIFGISPKETTFAKRGFQGEGRLRERFEEIGRTFVRGYHAALEENTLETLVPRLEAVANEFRGFAYEGAAMGLGLLDRVTPWNRERWTTFLAGPGQPHTYMLHVGLGWVFARMPWLFSGFDDLDPLLRWLVIDGYGFHDGFFNRGREPKTRTRTIGAYAMRAFDQGLGRSLWFSQCAGPEKIAKMIMAFELHRQPDLWSGVGLACAYAGDLHKDGVRLLLQVAGEFHPQLAQGVTFAAKARQRAGNLMPFTEVASRIICGMSAEEAAQVTDAALENLPTEAGTTYEVWRCRIQQRFAREKELKA